MGNREQDRRPKKKDWRYLKMSHLTGMVTATKAGPGHLLLRLLLHSSLLFSWAWWGELNSGRDVSHGFIHSPTWVSSHCLLYTGQVCLCLLPSFCFAHTTGAEQRQERNRGTEGKQKLNICCWLKALTVFTAWPPSCPGEAVKLAGSAWAVPSILMVVRAPTKVILVLHLNRVRLSLEPPPVPLLRRLGHLQ